ncbi:MAG: hypothetical protein LBL04_08890, partial [Bacteroidales bacterium]|nr:hypothetical protein [Bacteroidales bacterium]
MKKYSYIKEVLICCILCSITLFVTSHRFVNEAVTPKWLGLMLCTGISGFAWCIRGRKIILPAKPVDTILIICFLFVVVRASGSSRIYAGGLLLLFYLVRQEVTVCSVQYLYGTVMLFALALSLHGILQYAGVLPSTNGNFAVTGSFDNPAGFAAALACAFPLCFHFFTDQTKYVKHAA